MVIISIVASVALNKSFYNIDNALLLKAKSDVSLVQSALNEYKNRMLLKQENMNLYNLDEASVNTKDLKLFDKIIQDIVFISTSSDELKKGLWIKTSNNSYEFVISKDEQIEFKYDINRNKFECDLSKLYCADIIQ